MSTTNETDIERMIKRAIGGGCKVQRTGPARVVEAPVNCGLRTLAALDFLAARGFSVVRRAAKQEHDR